MSKLTLHHGAPSRSSTALWMLEETGAPYELQVLDLKNGEQRRAGYMAINPMGKVPALSIAPSMAQGPETVITEVGAICTYLADEHPAANLAPPIAHPLRGPYLRWMFFSGSTFEPALIDNALKREPGPPSMLPYGDFETAVGVAEAALSKGPYFLGERFSAVDVYLGSTIRWTSKFGILPARPAFTDYIARLEARPALQRAVAIDAGIIGRLGA